ncbi:MAG: hypothetical protein WA705_13910 [Candidatus Ozemobacteraceae bacterium]
MTTSSFSGESNCIDSRCIPQKRVPSLALFPTAHWDNPTGKLYWENKANEDEKHSLYLQGEIPFANDKWVFDAGFRRDHRYIIREEKSRVPTGKTQAVTNNQWEDPRDNSSFGLIFKPTLNDTLAFRYGLVDVSPVDRYATASGTALLDEKDKLMNVGYEHNFPKIKNTSLNLNFFTNQMQNALVDDAVNIRYTDSQQIRPGCVFSTIGPRKWREMKSQ